jgi:WD40 repeat protein
MALVLREHNSEVNNIVFSPTTPTLASADYSGLILLSDALTGQLIHRLEHHSGIINGLVFTTSGSHLLSIGQDHLLALWDVNRGILLSSIEVAPDFVESFVLTLNDSHIIIAGSNVVGYGEDETTVDVLTRCHITEDLKLTHLITRRPDVAIHYLQNKNDNIIGIRMIGDRIWVCDIVNGHEIQQLDGKISFLQGMVISPNGFFLATSDASRHIIQLWNIASGQQLHRLQGHSELIYCLEFNPKGNLLASGSADNTVRIWDVSKGLELEKFTGHTELIWDIAFSSDGKLLASASTDGTVIIWPLRTKLTPIKRASVESSNIASIGYSMEDRILEVEFHGGSVYQYYEVPVDVYIELMNSNSHGIYFDAYVKKAAYRYSKIT